MWRGWVLKKELREVLVSNSDSLEDTQITHSYTHACTHSKFSFLVFIHRVLLTYAHTQSEWWRVWALKNVLVSDSEGLEDIETHTHIDAHRACGTSC